jgi:hypothetical protein
LDEVVLVTLEDLQLVLVPMDSGGGLGVLALEDALGFFLLGLNIFELLDPVILRLRKASSVGVSPRSVTRFWQNFDSINSQ